MRFAGGAAWRGAFEEAIADHRGPIIAGPRWSRSAWRSRRLEVEETGGRGDRRAARRPLGGVLFGGAFEDRLPRRFEPGGQTLVEDDLGRATAAKASRRARMASAVSLSEASEIVPGRLFLARDLVRGGEPVRVTTRVGGAC